MKNLSLDMKQIDINSILGIAKWGIILVFAQKAYSNIVSPLLESVGVGGQTETEELKEEQKELDISAAKPRKFGVPLRAVEMDKIAADIARIFGTDSFIFFLTFISDAEIREVVSMLEGCNKLAFENISLKYKERTYSRASSGLAVDIKEWVSVNQRQSIASLL